MCSTVPYYVWNMPLDSTTVGCVGEALLSGCTVCKCLVGYGPGIPDYELMIAAQEAYDGSFNG